MTQDDKCTIIVLKAVKESNRKGVDITYQELYNLIKGKTSDPAFHQLAPGLTNRKYLEFDKTKTREEKGIHKYYALKITPLGESLLEKLQNEEDDQNHKRMQLRYSARLSKWQYKLYWISLLGGMAGWASLIYSIWTNNNKP